MMKNSKILIAGGGTGGHLFPAFAIGNKLKEEGADVTYIGSVYGIERNYKDKLKNKLYLLNIKGINRNLSIQSFVNILLFPFRFIISYIKSIIIIKRIRPHIVIGTGGYSSGIPLLAAIHLNITSIIHEQNSCPGITTNFLSNKVDKIFISYHSIKQFINNQNYLFTGNPVRENLYEIDKYDACAKIGVKPTNKIIFILGGSQGSKPFNSFFIKHYKTLIKQNVQIIWQTGTMQYNEISNLITEKQVVIKPFIDDINIAYSCSDIVVSRAGAMAIEELKKFNKAMILIPYPNAANNHQRLNALELVDNNAACLIEQNNIETKLINSILELLKNDSKRLEMGANAKKLYNPNSLDLIVKSIKEYIHV